MANEDSTSPEFWSKRYAAGLTPWDLHSVPAALEDFLARTQSRGNVLVPGCGAGYEVRAFHDAGYNVTALDFSPAAIERARDVLGPLVSKVQLGDFFTYDLAKQRFDLIYERTFLCSLPPIRWRNYAERMSHLIAPGGRLVGIFLYGSESEPPPFPLTDAEASGLFGGTFAVTRNEPLPTSLPVFKDMEERWQEWTRNV